MSPAIEAFCLPFLFLTVTLLGGLRLDARLALIPPSLFSLILAVLLVGVLIKSGALMPERLLSARRGVIANLNGALVLAALFTASAQSFSLVTPDVGLPRLMAGVLLLVLLLNTIAALPSRRSVLRSLAVVFGSAFALKFIVLAALSDPAGSHLMRVVMLLFEGVTFGVVTQYAIHPAAGYLAFVTLALFLTGLALLPAWKDIPAAPLIVQTASEDLVRRQP